MVLTLCEVNCQYLRAGFTIDSTCIYDLEPDAILSASYPTQTAQEFNIDCNRDGIIDFNILAIEYLSSHGMGETKSIRIVPLQMNKIAFSRIDTNEHSPSTNDILFPVAQKFLMGDTINNHLNFTHSTVYLSEASRVTGYYRIRIDDWIQNEGYIGVCLDESAKYYWIKVEVIYSTSISIMEFLQDCNISSLLIEIFPNPCSDFIYIMRNHPENEAMINIFNSNGILVKKFLIQLGNKQTKLNISDLNAGLYIIQIYLKTENRQTTEKIVVN